MHNRAAEGYHFDTPSCHGPGSSLTATDSETPPQRWVLCTRQALASIDHDIARPLVVGDRVNIFDRPEVADCREQNSAFGDFAYARVGTSACSGRCRGAQRFGLARRRGFAKHVVLTNDVLDRHALTESPAADLPLGKMGRSAKY